MTSPVEVPTAVSLRAVTANSVLRHRYVYNNVAGRQVNRGLEERQRRHLSLTLQALMIALGMIVRHELPDCVLKHALV